MSRLVDNHRQYLADEVRVRAFERAIAAVIRPGDVVIDLGSGSGILGLLACRAGAARVYAIESTGMVQPARAIADANGFGDRITIVNGFSGHITLPERADALVTDQIGHFGFDAGVVGFVADARRRLMKPEPRIVPSRIDLCVSPCEAPDVADAVDFWARRPAGFDMSPLRPIAANSGHPRMLDAASILAEPVTAGSIDLLRDEVSIAVAAEQTIVRPGTMHGVAGWFSAHLGGDVVMTNSPLSPDRIARRAVVFPIDRSSNLVAGDRVRTAMRILPDDQLVRWTVEISREDGRSERFSHSTLRGMLIPSDHLHRTRADFRPRLTARGKARMSVLELCDGRRPLAEIEDAVYERHRALFKNRGEAEVFVAEVVTGYAE